MNLTLFLHNLINEYGGLKSGFLHTCYISNKQLTEQLEKHIHFQKTTLVEMTDFLAVELDYGSFKCNVRFDIENSDTCDFKTIKNITPIIEEEEPNEIEFLIDVENN